MRIAIVTGASSGMGREFVRQLQVLGVKRLQHSLVMKVWMNQQKKPKNNEGLTV